MFLRGEANTMNTSTVDFADGRRVCLSYGVPFAVFVPGRGYLRRALKFSVTSSRHMNAFAGASAPALDEVAFAEEISPLDPKR